MAETERPTFSDRIYDRYSRLRKVEQSDVGREWAWHALQLLLLLTAYVMREERFR